MARNRAALIINFDEEDVFDPGPTLSAPAGAGPQPAASSAGAAGNSKDTATAGATLAPQSLLTTQAPVAAAAQGTAPERGTDEAAAEIERLKVQIAAAEAAATAMKAASAAKPGPRTNPERRIKAVKVVRPPAPATMSYVRPPTATGTRPIGAASKSLPQAAAAGTGKQRAASLALGKPQTGFLKGKGTQTGMQLSDSARLAGLHPPEDKVALPATSNAPAAKPTRPAAVEAALVKRQTALQTPADAADDFFASLDRGSTAAGTSGGLRMPTGQSIMDMHHSEGFNPGPFMHPMDNGMPPPFGQGFQGFHHPGFQGHAFAPQQGLPMPFGPMFGGPLGFQGPMHMQSRPMPMPDPVQPHEPPPSQRVSKAAKMRKAAGSGSLVQKARATATATSSAPSRMAEPGSSAADPDQILAAESREEGELEGGCQEAAEQTATSIALQLPDASPGKTPDNKVQASGMTSSDSHREDRRKSHASASTSSPSSMSISDHDAGNRQLAHAASEEEVPVLLAELRDVLRRKEGLWLRRKVLDSIFEDARQSFNALRGRESELRALLGDRADEASEEPFQVSELMTAASALTRGNDDPLESVVRNRRETLRLRATEHAAATKERLQQQNLPTDFLLLPSSPGPSQKDPDILQASQQAAPQEGKKSGPKQVALAEQGLGREKRKRAETDVPREASPAQRAKVNVAGPTPDDLRKALLAKTAQAAMQKKHVSTEPLQQAASKASSQAEPADSSHRPSITPATDGTKQPVKKPADAAKSQKAADAADPMKAAADVAKAKEPAVAAKPKTPAEVTKQKPQAGKAAAKTDGTSKEKEGRGAISSSTRNQPEKQSSVPRKESGSRPEARHFADKEKEAEEERRLARVRAASRAKRRSRSRSRGRDSRSRGRDRGRRRRDESRSRSRETSRRRRLERRSRSRSADYYRRRYSPDRRRKDTSSPERSETRRQASPSRPRNRRKEQLAGKSSPPHDHRRPEDGAAKTPDTAPAADPALPIDNAPPPCTQAQLTTELVLRYLRGIYTGVDEPDTSANKEEQDQARIIAARVALAIKDVVRNERMPTEKVPAKHQDASHLLVAIHKAVAAVLISKQKSTQESAKLAGAVAELVAEEVATGRLDPLQNPSAPQVTVGGVKENAKEKAIEELSTLGATKELGSAKMPVTAPKSTAGLPPASQSSALRVSSDVSVFALRAAKDLAIAPSFALPQTPAGTSTDASASQGLPFRGSLTQQPFAFPVTPGPHAPASKLSSFGPGAAGIGASVSQPVATTPALAHGLPASRQLLGNNMAATFPQQAPWLQIDPSAPTPAAPLTAFGGAGWGATPARPAVVHPSFPSISPSAPTPPLVYGLPAPSTSGAANSQVQQPAISKAQTTPSQSKSAQGAGAPSSNEAAAPTDTQPATLAAATTTAQQAETAGDDEVEEGVLGGVFAKPAGTGASKAPSKAPGSFVFNIGPAKNVQASPDGREVIPSTCFGLLAFQGLPSLEQLQQSLPVQSTPQIDPTPASATVPYESPLLTFRSYRLAVTYKSVSKLALSSRMYANRIKPNWPLCPFELHGTCRDVKCQYQMNMDIAMNNVEVLQDLAELAKRAKVSNPFPPPQLASDSKLLEKHSTELLEGARNGMKFTPLPGTGHAARASTRTRLPKEKIQEASVSGHAPVYFTYEQSKPQMPFRSTVLCSVQLPPSLFEGGALIGLEGFPRSLSLQKQMWQESSSASDGRYFSSRGKQAEDQTTADRIPSKLVESYEAQIQQDPLDEETWLAYALDTLQGGAEENKVAALKLLARALDKLQSASSIWLLYVHLYASHAGGQANTDVSGILNAALRYQHGCYHLWLLCIAKTAALKARIKLLQRGIIALALSDQTPGDSAEMRAACVLDLWLRLMHLMSLAQKSDLQTWLAVMSRETPEQTADNHSFEEVSAMDDRQLAQSARHMLRIAMHPFPRLSVVLWLSAAHLAAYGELPQEFVHRFGCFQRPAALEFTSAPPATVNSRVHSIFSIACGSGTACLNLRAAAEGVGRPFVSPEDAEAVQILALTLAKWHLASGTSAIVTSSAPKPVSGELFHPLLVAACRASDFVKRASQKESSSGSESVSPATQLVQLVCFARPESLIEELQNPAAAHSSAPRPGSAAPNPPAKQHSRMMQTSTRSGSIPQKSKASSDERKSAKAPWLKELYNLYSRDKDAFRARLAERSSEEKKEFKEFCIKVSEMKKAANASEKKAEDSGPSASIGPSSAKTRTLKAARKALESYTERMREIPGWTVEAPQGLIGTPPSAVAALAAKVCVHDKGNNQSALALLAASVVSIFSPKGPSKHQPERRDRQHSRSHSSSMRKTLSGSGKHNSPSPISRREQETRRRRSRSRSASRSGRSQKRGSARQARSPSRGRSRSRSSAKSKSSDSRGTAEGRSPSPRSRPAWDDLLEEPGSLSSSNVVRAAFKAVLLPASSASDRDMPEEGEILEQPAVVVSSWTVVDTVWTWLNLAMFEVLSGNASAAFEACERGLQIADGELKGAVWVEFLVLASSILLQRRASRQGTSTQPQVGTAAVPSRQDRFRLLLRLVQRYLTWSNGSSRLTCLRLPATSFLDAKLDRKLGPPPMSACDAEMAALVRMLPFLEHQEVALLIEMMTSRIPPAAGAAVIAVETFARHAASEQWASWAAPLTAEALAAAVPPPAPPLWLKAISLTEHHFVQAAQELASCAFSRHPHCPALAEKHVTLSGAVLGGGAKTKAQAQVVHHGLLLGT